MKKVLSICFLSMLLLMAAFTAKAQTATDCCFWLESMNPDTLHDVSNIGVDASGVAHLPGSGVDMLMANKLKPVETVNLIPINIASTIQWIGDKTDWYRVKFFNNCNLPGNTRVSLEWKMYYNGTLLNDAEISNYVDMFIYTKYTQMNNNDSVLLNNGRLKWLGGLVTGPGQSHQVPNGCLGGYPGAVKDDPGIAPDGFPDFDAAGMVQISNGYNLDFFNLYFFENAETRIGFRWKQAGEYSIVLTLRERVGGTEFVIWHDATQSGYIGGNQSRCGGILAQDSIVNPSEKEYTKLLCDGDGMWIGIPPAYYTVPGTYTVVFTKPGCNGEEVDSIHYITFENRVKPAIVGHDTILCRNEAFDVNAMKSLAPPVDIDAQNFIRHEIFWKANGAAESAWTQNPTAPSTAAAATFTYNIYQVNFYGNDYDTIECAGPIDTLTITVNDIFPPELDNTNAEYSFCINGTETSQVIKAKLNNPEGNACADEIHWFDENGTETVAFSKTVDLTPYKATNINKNVTFTAYAYATSSSTYSVGSVTVTLHFYAYPELSVQNREDFVKCPRSTFSVNPTVTCTNISANTFSADDLTWTYQWKKNGANYATTKNINVTAPACDVTDTYVLTATATAPMGCTNTITYTFSVTGQNPQPIRIAWGTAPATVTLNAGCDTMSMAAPFTLADVRANGPINPTQNVCSNLASIHYSASVDESQAPCKLIVTRSYYVTDECGNVSNTISQVVTINNKVVPTITGTPVEIPAVRDIEHNNCTAKMPTRAELLTYFKNNFTWSTCNTTVSDDNIEFFVGNTDVVADGNLDIFHASAQVDVYARVTDECGNATQKFRAFWLVDFEKFIIRPEPFSYNLSKEVCNTDTIVVVFDPDHIWAGYYPFTFDWEKIDLTTPNNAAHTVAISGHADTVWAVNRGPVTTQAKFALTVTDKYGCKAYDTTDVVTFYAQPTVEIVEATSNNDYPHAAPVVVCPNFGNYKVLAQATSNIDDPTLTYTWSQDATGSNADSQINVTRNNCTKDYTAKVTVKNAKNCAATATYTVRAEDTEAPVVTVEDVTDTVPVVAGCKIAVPNYATNGKVTATDNCWSGSDITITQNPVAGTLLTENTDVVITVSTPCGPATTKTIKVCFPRPMEVEVTANNNAICEESPVTLTANVTRGTAPYTYKWDNKNNTNVQAYTITPAASETHHSVVVTDANGCTANDDIDITIYPKFNFALTPHPDTDCSADINNGSIDITPNSGATFELFQGTTSLGNTFTGLAAGQYKVVATVNGNNCVYNKETTVGTDYTYPNIQLTSTPNHFCREAEFDGTITVTDIQTVKNYNSLTYYVNGAEYTSSPIEHLMHGDYTVVAVTDLHCSSNQATVVVDDQTNFTATITTTPNNYCEVTANHPGNGTITVTSPVGNHYTYTYEGLGMSPVETTNPTLGNLGDGNYDVTVFDQNTGCSYEERVTVNRVLDVVTVTPSTTPDHTCDLQLADGTITLTATSTLANPSWVYKLDNGQFVTNNIFTNIANGSHVYTVKNLVSGCETQNEVAVESNPETLTFHAMTVPNTMCDNTSNGSLTVVVDNCSNANPSFNYKLGDGNYQTSNVFTGLNDQSYQVYVIDLTTNCEFNKNVEIEKVHYDLTFDATPVANTQCNPAMYDGSVTVSNIVTNIPGTANLSYSLIGTTENGTPVSILNQTSPVFNGLGGGSYTVVVTDVDRNCDYNKPVVVATDNIYLPNPVITVTGMNNSTDEIALHFCLNNPATLVGSATSAYPNDEFEFDWRRACGDYVIDPNSFINYVPYLDNTPSFTLPNTNIDTCIYLLSVTSTRTQCSNYTNVRIIVDPNPNAVITIDGTPWTGTDPYEICVNKATTTVAVNTNPSPYPIATIEWTGAKTANTASFTIAANEIPAGTTNQYNVHVVDVNGCSSDNSVRIHSKPIFTNTVTVNECDSVQIHGQWFRYADNASHTFTKVVNLTAANGCDSTVTYNITLRVSPSLAVTISPNELGAYHCAGNTLMVAGLGYTQANATEAGWIMIPANNAASFTAPTKANFKSAPYGVAFDIHTTLTYAMNGSKIYAFAANNCDTVFSPVYTLRVNDKPYLPNNKKKMQDGTICLGNTYNMSLPSSTDVVWNTAGSKTFTTQYRELPNGTWNSISGSIYHFTPDAVGQYAFRAVASNMCGDVTVDTATVTVNDTVTLTVTNKEQVILLGDAIADVQITNTYSTLAVSALPAGLTLSNNKITGKPTAAGFYKIAIDANGLCKPKSDTVRIEVRDTLYFTVTPPSDRVLCVNTPMDPIHFDVTNGYIAEIHPALIAGLSLDQPDPNSPDRDIIGTPTELDTNGSTYTLIATSSYTDLPKPADKVLKVTIKVIGKPIVTAPAPVPTVAACEGATFTKPADPEVVRNGSPLLSTTGWYYNGAAFDWNTAANMSMNGQNILYIAENECGRDTAFYPVTVYPTPVPEIKNDDAICRMVEMPRGGYGAQVQLLNPDNYASWTWYKNGSEYMGYQYDQSTINFFSDVAGDYVFTIVVTDKHGCTSTTATNVSNPTFDFSVSNAVTIRVKEDFEFTVSSTPNVNCSGTPTGAITMNPATADGVTYKLVNADNMGTHQYTLVTENQTDWSGYYLLVSQPTSGAENGNTVALHGVTSGNGYGLYDNVTSYVSGNAIAYNSTTEDAEVVIRKVEGAANEDKYTIYQEGVGYFGYSGSNNTLKALSTAPNESYWWQLSISNGNLTITNAAEPTRKLQFNNSAPRFATYTSNQTPCKLFKWGWEYAYLSSFENLPAGDYAVVAYTSNPECEFWRDITVEDNFTYPVISATSTPNIYCDQTQYDGTITIQDAQTNPNYTSVTYYVDGNAITGNEATGLAPGTYTISAVSSNNCAAQQDVTVTVGDISGFTATFNVNNNHHCDPDRYNGTIEVVVSDNHSNDVNRNFRYSINGSAWQEGNKFTNLGGGTYGINVIDLTTGCEYFEEVSVDNDLYTFTIATTTTDNTNCDQNNPNGSITITVSGNQNPEANYRYQITFGQQTLTATTTATSYTFNNLMHGQYDVVVEDIVSGCTQEDDPEVVSSNVNTPTVSITATGTNNYSGNDEAYHFCLKTEGSLTGSATSVYPNDAFTYTWDVTPAVYTSNVTVETSVAGERIYKVTAKSVYTGCEAFAQAKVKVDPLPENDFTTDYSDGEPVISPVSNCANEAITIYSDASSDAGIASYAWSGAKTSNTNHVTFEANEITSGTMISEYLTITDNYGCMKRDTIKINSLPISQVTVNQAVCDEFELEQIGRNKVYYHYFKYPAHPELEEGFDGNTYFIHKTFKDTLEAANGCDSIVTYNITLKPMPQLYVDVEWEEDPIYCVKDIISGISFTHEYAQDNGFGWVIVPGDVTAALVTDPHGHTIGGQPFDITTPLTYAMNGKQIYAYSYNSCDTLVSDLYRLAVGDTIKLTPDATRMTDVTVCLGETANVHMENGANVNFNQPYGIVGGSLWFKYYNVNTGSRNNLSEWTNGQELPVGVYRVYLDGENWCTHLFLDSCLVTVKDTVTLEVAPLTQTIILGQAITNVVSSSNYTITYPTTLPEGLSRTNNTISGSPVAAGTHTITISANGTNVCYPKTVNVTIIVRDTVKMTPPTVEREVCLGYAIEPINITLENGVLESGYTLPAGLSLSQTTTGTTTTITISGTPTTMNTSGYTFTLTGKSMYTNDPIPASKTTTVTIIVNDKPSFDNIVETSIQACKDQLFTPITVTNLKTNGEDLIADESGWFLGDDEWDWTTPATSEMNGQKLVYKATNNCGTTADTVTLVVLDIPEPEIISDTVICPDGIATLRVVNTQTGYTYQWYKDGVEISGATNAMYEFDASTVTPENDYHFTVVVTDENNCQSTTNINTTVDRRTFTLDDQLTVRVSDKPGFIFKHYSNTPIHQFNSSVDSAHTHFTWELNDQCDMYNGNRVFVTFDIYHNGVLIPNDSLPFYIAPEFSDVNNNMSSFSTSDWIQWLNWNNQVLSDYSYYKFSQAGQYYETNHYPASSMYNSETEKYDYLFLHFLNHRPVTKTINRFLRPGEYTFHYKLYNLNTQYNDEESWLYIGDDGATHVIGGTNSLTHASWDVTMLNEDKLVINVSSNMAGETEDITETTGIEDVVVAEETAASMVVYPNPATTQVNARINGVNGETSIRIVNIAGQVVTKDNVVIDVPEYIYRREVSNLTPGVYFMYVEGQNATLNKKFVITK